jgi:hypothetical protein
MGKWWPCCLVDLALNLFWITWVFALLNVQGMKLASGEREKAKESRGFYTLVVVVVVVVVVVLDITGKSFTKVYPLTHIFFQNKVEGDFADGTRGPGGESKIT